MANLIGAPKIDRLQDILDIGNQTWAGVEINFHVKPAPGEEWEPDFSAACMLDGEPALVPEAMEQLRKWDKDPESSFYCYAPVGYLRDGTRMTLQIHPRDKKGRPEDEIIWEGDFLVRVEDEEYRLQRIISLSTATQEELQDLPGIGPKIAEAIISYRETHGSFTSLDQLDDVPMVGRDKIEALEKFIRP